MNETEFRAPSVIVRVEPFPLVEGEVRVVSVWRGTKVVVDFISVDEYLSGDWDPGVRYIGRYETPLDAQVALELHFGEPLAMWINRSRHPARELDVGAAKGQEVEDIYRQLVHARALPVPPGTDFRLSSPYWRQIEEFGEFDENRALEEFGDD